MAPAGALGCLAKRDLLASNKASSDKLRSQAQAFKEAGMDYDALRFLAAAGETGELARMAEGAVGRGDLFLYLQVLKELGQEPDPENLLKLAKAARDKGYLSFAAQAEALASPDESQADG